MTLLTGKVALECENLLLVVTILVMILAVITEFQEDQTPSLSS